MNGLNLILEGLGLVDDKIVTEEDEDEDEGANNSFHLGWNVINVCL